MKNLERDTKIFIPSLVFLNIVVILHGLSFNMVLYTLINVFIIGYMLYKDLRFKDVELKHYFGAILVIYYMIITFINGPLFNFTSVLGILQFIGIIPLIIIAVISLFKLFDGYRSRSKDINEYKNFEDGNRANRTTAHTYTNQGSGKGGTNWMARSIMQEDTKTE